MLRVRLHIPAVLLMLALAGSVVSCRKTAPAAPASGPDPVTVSLVPVQTRPAERWIELTGTLYGEEEASVAAEVPGRVLEVRADLGDRVEPAGVLAVLDETDYRLAVEQERAGLAASLAKIGLSALPPGDVNLSALPPVARAAAQQSNASARFERARKLYEREPPLISEQDFADIRTQLEVASTSAQVESLNAGALVADARVRASALAAAEERLSDTRITAPRVAGLTYRVAARRVSIGEVVAQGQVMFRLIASDRVKFRGLVPERFIGRFAVGAKAKLRVDAFETPFDATVTRISPAVDPASRSFEVEIEAPNAEDKLKPGGFARASISTGTQANARFLPESAVSQFAGVQRVYAVKDGKVTEHRVEVGPAAGGQRELLTPLDGITSIIDAPRGLREGLPARVAP